MGWKGEREREYICVCMSMTLHNTATLGQCVQTSVCVCDCTCAHRTFKQCVVVLFWGNLAPSAMTYSISRYIKENIFPMLLPFVPFFCAISFGLKTQFFPFSHRMPFLLYYPNAFSAGYCLCSHIVPFQTLPLSLPLSLSLSPPSPPLSLYDLHIICVSVAA